MRSYKNCLLAPEDSVVALIDYQPQMIFGVQGAVREQIINGATGLAKACQTFGVPCVLTTVTAHTFAGNLISQIQNVFPDITPIDRTNINAWEDANFQQVVVGSKRKKLIIGGLWTEACALFPSLCALSDGYEVYVVTDICGGSSRQSHITAVERMSQAGVIPVTWQQVMLEWQRDWANKATYNGVMSIVKEHGGAYGMGVEYSEEMLPPQG
jgi:nicotinamidase-related amidase